MGEPNQPDKSLHRPTAPSCRLYILFARRAPRAVIFRRGPTDWTRLILWHTDTDEFEAGQWFRGRIFERRSDLAPDGQKLIYFARKTNWYTLHDEEYTTAWTAISKPPYYTALALWPKGDTWHGGGLFIDDRTVFLNHRPENATPHPDHRPKFLDVRPNPDARGENDPVYSAHLSRDGWMTEQEWIVDRGKYPIFYITKQPEIRIKRRKSKEYVLSLTRRVDDLRYSERFEVKDLTGKPIIDTTGVAWLDWDQQDRLIVLRQGKLLIAEETPGLTFQVRELADFNSHKPKPMEAPDWAKTW